MKYTRLFQTDQQLEAAYNGSDYIEPWLALSKESETVTYNKTEEQKLLGTPLTFEIVSGGNITWMASDNNYTKTIEYKKNDGEWTEITSAHKESGEITALTTDFGIFVYDGYNGDYHTWTGASGTVYSNQRDIQNDPMYDAEGPFVEVTAVANGGSAITTTLGTFIYSGHYGPDNYTSKYYWTGAGGTLATYWISPSEINVGIGQVFIENFTNEYLEINPPTISVALGDIVQFRGNNSAYASGATYSASWYNCFSGSTASFNAKGNIMSLINSTGFTTATLQTTWTFYGLFQNTKLTNASKLVLAPKVLTDSCYRYMFYSCKNLINPPVLPATTLANNCYQAMFQVCTVLNSAPELPATTLANSCYTYMFYGCTSLTQTPALPATELASSCYESMFLRCTSLNSVPELPATTLANGCYRNMFQICTGLTTVPAIFPATTLANQCYEQMFSGCTSLTTAPELPAMTLAERCYNSMFLGCTSLTVAPELPATTLADTCYGAMFRDCTGLTTAPVTLPATTLVDWCYSNMFLGCTSLTVAPELPATTLAIRCYNGMFSGCTNLSSITSLATDISASNCTQGWVTGVASSGTFAKAAGMNSWTTGVNGIPNNWTVQNAS